jgi:lipocalin
MKWFLFIGYIVLCDKFVRILGCTPPSFDSLTVPSNFSLNKFLGIWFEVQWLPGEPHNASDIWRNFYQSFQFEDSSKQKLLVTGKARVLNNNTCFSVDPWLIIVTNTAKMILEKQDLNSSELLNWPYYVLKTDYDHYALIYSCTTVNYTYSVPCAEPVLWVFSRSATLSTDYTTELDQYIENQLCINQTDLEITPQDGVQCYSSSTNHVISIILFVFLFVLYI